MNHRFLDYQPYKGEIPGRQNGSLISLEQGTSIPFSHDQPTLGINFLVNEEGHVSASVGFNASGSTGVDPLGALMQLNTTGPRRSARTRGAQGNQSNPVETPRPGKIAKKVLLKGTRIQEEGGQDSGWQQIDMLLHLLLHQIHLLLKMITLHQLFLPQCCFRSKSQERS